MFYAENCGTVAYIRGNSRENAFLQITSHAGLQCTVDISLLTIDCAAKAFNVGELYIVSAKKYINYNNPINAL